MTSERTTDTFGFLENQKKGSLGYHDGVNWRQLPVGTSGQFLWVASGAPAWRTLASGDLPAHNLLSTNHGDTAAQTVSRGSLVYGNSTPAWDELTIGAAGTLLSSNGTDVSWLSTAWNDITFDAANFTADSGNWTVASGDQTNLRYLIVGKTMVLTWNINTSTVSATPTNLRITLPLSKTCNGRADGVYWRNNAGLGWTLGQWRTLSGNTFIEFYLDPNAGNWTTSTDTTSVRGTATFEVA